MNKQETIFCCANCGDEFAKWQGKCSSCGSWNTLKEVKQLAQNKKNTNTSEIINLNKVKIDNFKRIDLGITEFDRVLGGGMVPGSVILLGGEPGIGKSTLVLQVASKLKNTYYIAGEESAQQIKMRAQRLKINNGNISLISENNIDAALNTLKKEKPALVIVDSIQSMYTDEYPSTAGSIVQVRETALKLQKYAKQNNISVILIGHVTKDGTVAGPKTLEHMVDVVLYLEGERYYGTRILRTVKNRFGATDEIGLFEIFDGGLKEITNPAKIFIGQNAKNSPGSIITATVEGTRPFLVEIQALTSTTAFGYPTRTASGFDLNRLKLIIAILINRADLKLQNQDVYVNVAGGFNLKEPAADLAVALAIASAIKNTAVNIKTVAFGELGLAGEVRSVNFESKRISEIKRLGYNNIVKQNNIQKIIKEIF